MQLNLTCTIMDTHITWSIWSGLQRMAERLSGSLVRMRMFPHMLVVVYIKSPDLDICHKSDEVWLQNKGYKSYFCSATPTA